MRVFSVITRVAPSFKIENSVILPERAKSNFLLVHFCHFYRQNLPDQFLSVVDLLVNLIKPSSLDLAPQFWVESLEIFKNLLLRSSLEDPGLIFDSKIIT